MQADLMFRWKGHELQPTLLMNLSQTQRDENHWNKQPAGYMVIYFNQYFNNKKKKKSVGSLTINCDEPVKP